MRYGFALPQIGPLAGAESLLQVASRAEELEYDSLWVLDRVLWPTDPQAPYPATPDGSLPEEYQTVLDPLETLTYVAARTSRIRLGTSVLNLPYYNPVLLARQLTTVDVLSGGRLLAGVGNGWSPDEFEAVGTEMGNRGARATEALQVLKSIWTENPVRFEGEHYRVPESVIKPKPIQDPHPPIYGAAFVEPALQRVAEHTDGWFPVEIPLDQLGGMYESVRAMASEVERDPEALELIVRANLKVTDEPLGSDRADFTGSLEQIRDDAETARELGADELVFDAQFTPGVDSNSELIRMMEELRGSGG